MLSQIRSSGDNDCSRPRHSAPQNGPKQTIRRTQGFFTFEAKRAAIGLSGPRGDEAGFQTLGKICSRLVRSLFWESEIDQFWPKDSRIFFWPNFDVKKEQISNTKREHGQTDAENPYKTAIIARHRPELRHQKRQNECRISLKTKQRRDRTNRVFPNARRPEKDHREPHQDNTHSEKTKGTNLWTPYNDRMQTRHVGTSQ